MDNILFSNWCNDNENELYHLYNVFKRQCIINSVNWYDTIPEYSFYYFLYKGGRQGTF
jgi:hypothetical protein